MSFAHGLRREKLLAQLLGICHCAAQRVGIQRVVDVVGLRRLLQLLLRVRRQSDGVGVLPKRTELRNVEVEVPDVPECVSGSSSESFGPATHQLPHVRASLGHPLKPRPPQAQQPEQHCLADRAVEEGVLPLLAPEPRMRHECVELDICHFPRHRQKRVAFRAGGHGKCPVAENLPAATCGAAARPSAEPFQVGLLPEGHALIGALRGDRNPFPSQGNCGRRNCSARRDAHVGDGSSGTPVVAVRQLDG
eukprot:13875464-Alexandrium_andersonii.AAC.1